MAFILPSDPGYLRAKQAKQGLRRLPAPFDNLASQIEQRYDIRPLWLELDELTNPPRRQRLSVVLERTAQYGKFSRNWNFDRDKQRAIAKMFNAVTTPGPWSTLLRGTSKSVSDLFVCFDDFERAAKREAHDSFTPDELVRFETGLGLGDVFWTTSRFSGPPVVFVYTEDQAEELRFSDAQERWADLYFQLVKPHDEFDYLQRDEIKILVDSKAHFDRDYSSNWYYYLK
jgi:hypothetical protein